MYRGERHESSLILHAYRHHFAGVLSGKRALLPYCSQLLTHLRGGLQPLPEVVVVVRRGDHDSDARLALRHSAGTSFGPLVEMVTKLKRARHPLPSAIFRPGIVIWIFDGVR